MKAKKWLSIITFGCSIISAIIAFLIGKPSNSIFYDFSMAVFGSALLGFIMSIIEYNVERRTAIEAFWIESRKALAKLRKIKYFNADAPLDKILNCFAEEQGNEFVEKMGSTAGNLSLKVEHTKRDDLISWFEENIPMPFSPDDKIKEYRNLALAEQRHFQLLTEGKGNFAVCAKKAMDICGKVFEVKEFSTDTHYSKVVYQTVFDDIDDALEVFRCKIYYKKQETVLEHNPICESYKNILDDEKDFEG